MTVTDHVTAGLYRERPVRHAQCEGRAEGNGEPDETARQKAPHTLAGLGADAGLPERLVDEHCAERTCRTGLLVTISWLR